jgi:hypothetical protein
MRDNPARHQNSRHQIHPEDFPGALNRFELINRQLADLQAPTDRQRSLGGSLENIQQRANH